MYFILFIDFLVKFGKSIRARLTHKNDIPNNMNNINNNLNNIIKNKD